MESESVINEVFVARTNILRIVSDAHTRTHNTTQNTQDLLMLGGTEGETVAGAIAFYGEVAFLYCVDGEDVLT